MKLYIKILPIAFLLAFAAGFSVNWDLVLDLLGLNAAIWSFSYGYYISQVATAMLITTFAPVAFFYFIGKRNPISAKCRKLAAVWMIATYFGYFTGVLSSILLYNTIIYPYDIDWYFSSQEAFINQLLIPCLLVSFWSLYMFFAGFFGFLVGSNRKQAKKSSS
jgi:hypothetical protein